jgi:hypothetical protein
MYLNWIKCSDGNWCNFLTVDINHGHFNSMEGVYVIWYNGPTRVTVYVGQGIIRDRIAEHRQENAVLSFQGHGLHVTWAKVQSIYRNGIERYLWDELKPKVGSRCPDFPPIQVNLPW